MTATPLEFDGPLGRVLQAAGDKRRRSGSGWLVRCPAHRDRAPSLSVTEGSDGRVLLNCHAGCNKDDIVAALGMTMADLFPTRPHLASTSPVGCTLDDMAERTKLPRDVLIGLGWSDAEFHGRRAVHIPYEKPDRSVHRVRVRRAVTGEKRFAWGEGQGTIAYDPDHGALAAELTYLIVAEGETDTATLLYAGMPALGIPGANHTHVIALGHLEGVKRVFAVEETDAAGSQFVAGVRSRLAELGFAGLVYALPMPDQAKDPNALWQRDPVTQNFRAKLEAAMREAMDGPRPAYRLLADMIAETLRPVGQRLTTGFPTLDAATRGGLPLGRVIVVTGAPGAGKSTLAVQLVDLFERQGAAVVYLAADEPAEGILVRFGQLAGFSRDILEGEGPAGDAVRAGFAQRCRARAVAVVDPDADQAMRTIEDAEKALVHLAEQRPRVLIIDSLQTAPCAAAEGVDSARERVDAKVSVAKAIAKRGALVVAISEMARAGYRSGDRSENVSALAAGKESGSIEYAGALLLGLRSVKGEHGQVDVEVAKNRLGGSKPEFRILLDAERASFAEIEMPDADEQKAQAQSQRSDEVFRKLRDAVLRQSSPLTSKNKLVKAAQVRKTEGFEAIDEMLARGELVQDEHSVYRWNLRGEGAGVDDD